MDDGRSIETTIAAAIDRACDATMEVDGIDLEQEADRIKWPRYAAEMRNMAEEWETPISRCRRPRWPGCGPP